MTEGPQRLQEYAKVHTPTGCSLRNHGQCNGFESNKDPLHTASGALLRCSFCAEFGRHFGRRFAGERGTAVGHTHSVDGVGRRRKCCLAAPFCFALAL